MGLGLVQLALCLWQQEALKPDASAAAAFMHVAQHVQNVACGAAELCGSAALPHKQLVLCLLCCSLHVAPRCCWCLVHPHAVCVVWVAALPAIYLAIRLHGAVWPRWGLVTADPCLLYFERQLHCNAMHAWKKAGWPQLQYSLAHTSRLVPESKRQLWLHILHDCCRHALRMV